MELGIGIGWRPEIADAVERLPGVDWVEVVAENLCPGHLPESLVRLRRRGVTVVPHGVSLGLGGADRPDPGRLADLAARAEALSAPLVTEHIAFVRAGGALTASPRLEAGHLLPVPRTWDALEVLCENVRIAQDCLPVPLALENIAALVNWPDEDMTEGQFLAELVERTGVRLLIDVANLHTNRVNRGEDPAKALAELPVEAIAYVHVAGGVEKDGVWHDTHAHPVGSEVLDVLAELVSRVSPPGVLLERDDAFPPEAELAGELGAIRAVLAGISPTPPLPETLRGWVGVKVPPPGATPPDPHAGPAAPAPRFRGSAPDPAPQTPEGLDLPRSPEHDGLAEPVLSAEPGGSAPDTPNPLRGAGNCATSPHRPADERRGSGAKPPVAGLSHPPGRPPRAFGKGRGGEDARLRVALAQTSLLSALVAGTPVPQGFDPTRLRVQARALAAKRADVVAKVAPELPGILGDAYRPAYLSYARSRPMRDGYRRDALDFVESLLKEEGLDGDVARQLGRWWKERAGTRPQGRAARFLKGLVRAA
ncbi:multinuclear nonheme iron-dependent oxidase [Streptomyces melanogenes]|uniref:multinuclear nonheme iron-dependent oxidase n=1 Tax=Streptomyces melanogenes TaxID=67326 RepID=UPI0037A23907